MPALVWSCLTLVQAWLARGRPAPAKRIPFGMFEAWNDVVGGILATAGSGGSWRTWAASTSGPTRKGLPCGASSATWWGEHPGVPVMVAQLFPLASHETSLLELDGKTIQGQRVQLGKLLTALEGSRFVLDADLTVVVQRTGERRQGAVLWQLVQVPLQQQPTQGRLPLRTTDGDGSR